MVEPIVHVCSSVAVNIHNGGRRARHRSSRRRRPAAVPQSARLRRREGARSSRPTAAAGRLACDEGSVLQRGRVQGGNAEGPRRRDERGVGRLHRRGRRAAMGVRAGQEGGGTALPRRESSESH